MPYRKTPAKHKGIYRNARSQYASSTSLNTHVSSEEEDDTIQNEIEKLFEDSDNIVHARVASAREDIIKLTKEIYSTISTEGKELLKGMAKTLLDLDKWATTETLKRNQQKKLNDQIKSERDSYKEKLEAMINTIPSAEVIVSSVAAIFAEKLKDDRATTQQPETETDEQGEPEPQQQQQRHNPEDHHQQKFAYSQSPIKRTLIVKTRKEEPGKEIRQRINNLGIIIPAGAVQEMTTNRKSVEICCRSTKDREILKRELERRKEIFMNCYIMNKPEKQERVILTGVSTEHNAASIKEELENYFNVPDGQIAPLFSYKTRQGNANSVIGSPLDVTAQLVNHGSFFIGTNHIRLRPYVTVQRCKRCQSLGHGERQCSNPYHCVGCGDAHQVDIECKEPLRCINCTRFNRSYNANVPTNHKASDSRCHSYRYAFEEERHRQDDQYFAFFEKLQQLQEPEPRLEYPPINLYYESHPAYEIPPRFLRQVPEDPRRPSGPHRQDLC